MEAIKTASGLPGVDELAWGDHICHFYRTREDLVDSLVPFFKVGLENNESCLWVTAEPFRAHEAHAALKAAVPDLDRRVRAGQIEIIDHDQWYLQSGHQTDSASIVQGWLQRSERALAAGFNGLRLTGNTHWLTTDGWRDFVDYEQQINETFRHHRIIGLCSYCMSHCGNDEVFDVVRNHDFALARRDGEWQRLENSSLKIAKDELQRLAAQLEQRVAERTAELEAALRARDDFLSVASHELKTPLASLQLYVETLLRGCQRNSVELAEVPGRLEKVRQQGRRLDKLIDNLLDVSRAANTGLTLAPEPLDLTELVADGVDRFSSELARAGCAVRLQAPGPLLGLWDRHRLEQVVTNLLANVVSHAPGGPVTIALSSDQGNARLTVSDSGAGIEPQAQAQVFGRFVQAAPGRSHGGFGLGLWMVREIAQAHGGSVELASSPGRGASFTVTLPLVGSGSEGP